VQPVEPFLDFKRFEVLGNLTAPLSDQCVANVVLKDGLCVLRLRTGGDLWVELDLEVVLRKFVESDPAYFIAGVDPDTQRQTICLKRCIVFRRDEFLTPLRYYKLESRPIHRQRWNGGTQ
jgi:hypothetical protein